MCMRKMSTYNKTLGAAALMFAFGVAGANAADGPHFGQPISPADLAPWDISIGPDGVGLPAGSGTPAQGAQVYADHGCAACQDAEPRWLHHPLSGKALNQSSPRGAERKLSSSVPKGSKVEVSANCLASKAA